jgi:hypothetical protein
MANSGDEAAAAVSGVVSTDSDTASSTAVQEDMSLVHQFGQQHERAARPPIPLRRTSRSVSRTHGAFRQPKTDLFQISLNRALNWSAVSWWFLIEMRFSECLVDDDSLKFALPKKTSLPTTPNFSCMVFAF